MGNSLRGFIASLLLVPWGLCSPQRPQVSAPADICPSDQLAPGRNVWVSRYDVFFSIDVNIITGDLHGYYSFVTDVETGDVEPSSNHLLSGTVDIAPYYDSGTLINNITVDVSNYTIWINSEPQTTPNFFQAATDYTFAGVYPRIDMIVNRSTSSDYFLVSFQNPTQGAVGVTLPDYQFYHCDPAK